MSTPELRHLLAAAAGAAIGLGFCVLASRYLRSHSVDTPPVPHQTPPPAPHLPDPTAGLAGRLPAGHQAAAGDGAPHSVAEYEGDEVLEEQFTRNVQFFGSEGQRKAARALVVVVGLGVRPFTSHKRSSSSWATAPVSAIIVAGYDGAPAWCAWLRATVRSLCTGS